MTAETVVDWERCEDGGYLSIPITYRGVSDARTCCGENCESNFLIVLGSRILFQLSDDAALATLWWRCEDD